jgi:alkylmercury lyase
VWQFLPAIREFHRAVLRSFLVRGQVHYDHLRPTATALGIDVNNAMHQLAAADLVHTAPNGQIEVAYPFSGRPTAHTVHVAGHRYVADAISLAAIAFGRLLTG